MTVDGTITIGNIITMLTVLFAVGLWVSKVTSAIKELQQDIHEGAVQLREFMQESREDRRQLRSAVDLMIRERGID